MITIVEKHGEIEVFKSYSRYVTFYKIFSLLSMLIISFIIGEFFNLLSVLCIISYLYMTFFSVSIEKITIKDNYLLIEALRNNKKTLYSKKILLDEIKKVYFKDALGISFLLDPRILNYLVYSRQKFIKIETDKKTYSFGLFIEYQDFLKIDGILQSKLKEYQEEKIIVDEPQEREEELLNIYNLETEERYYRILENILKETRIILLEQEGKYFLNPMKSLQEQGKEIDFYFFYVNYLMKEEYQEKTILVGYNGIDGKEVFFRELKEDINKIRDSR